ncbi:hypothetical protein ACMYR3_06805 [Ampullimonas aquatilis]|uniref:hypothetical protein n=1 Tax=Ampullimonas aquatilis TaxID=1341549 RepID=UPI003C73F1A2
MKSYEIYAFKDHLADIEEFFIEIAANEERLLTFGYRHALKFQTAEKAFEGLKSFNEDFSSLKRYMLKMDRTLGEELEQLEASGKLIEQVSLIALRLRMSEIRKPMSGTLAGINQVFFYLPYFSRFVKSKGLFGDEPVSLQKTIINLGRLKGLANICYELVNSKDSSDDEVFKPSNVKPERVIDLIEKAIAEVENISSISPTERARIEGYLHEAKKEVLSTSPSWSKIVGALVIVAAVTSGIADAPNAAKSIKDAIEYILGSSVEKALQKYLPPPTENEQPPVPSGTLA